MAGVWINGKDVWPIMVPVGIILTNIFIISVPSRWNHILVRLENSGRACGFQFLNFPQRLGLFTWIEMNSTRVVCHLVCRTALLRGTNVYKIFEEVKY